MTFAGYAVRSSRRPSSVFASSISTVPTDVCDVWSHWGIRYRTRALVLLLVNVVLFAGLGTFAFWIRSGTFLAPAMPGYWDEFVQTFWFVGNTRRVLGSMLIEPISVQDVPMQIPIIGLLMAAMISIPILVSLLYRVWASLPFAAIVGFLAVMPWLAITLLCSCIIASVRPFRSRYPFMSALIGVVPVVVYLILAYKGTADVLIGQIDPIDRVKFFAPWVLAVVSAVGVFAVVLTISRWVNYRPGAITPLLALMFCLPVILFEYHVGRDELHYRLLERAAAHRFEDVDASIALSRRAELEWNRHPFPRPSFEALRQRLAVQWQFELGTDIEPYQAELVRNQWFIVDQCDRFLRYHPDSRYALNVLYLRARTLDMRVAPAEYRDTKWIRYYDDFPSPASRETWQALWVNACDSTLGAVAGMRLAQFEARDGDVERSIDRLTHVIHLMSHSGDTPFPPLSHERIPSRDVKAGASNPLNRQSPQVGLRIPIAKLRVEASRLRDLLVNNANPVLGWKPFFGARRAGDRPSFGWLDFNPRDERYPSNLESLRRDLGSTTLDDNLALELAMNRKASSDRIRELENCIEQFPDGDARPEAVFRAAVAWRFEGRFDLCETRLEQLARQYPRSIWAEQAYAVSRRGLNSESSTDIARAGSPSS